MYSESPARAKSFTLAVQLLALHKAHITNRALAPFMVQLVRSATSIGANLEEAIGAESRADFRHKLAIAHKESRETQYWLRVLTEAQYLSTEETTELSLLATEIVKILYRNVQKLK